MRTLAFIAITISVFISLLGCSQKSINFVESSLHLVNREISFINESTNTVALDNKEGDGIAIIEDVDFENGTIEIDLKGEDTPGRSFVGIAFNIQNDSTYEAVYFRPFNFQSEEKIRREHSVQYISHPKNTWRYLRSNHKGQYEAEYKRQPKPEDWFTVTIVVDPDTIEVIDNDSGDILLSVERLEEQKVNKVGLWAGFNSKGVYRNLRTGK